MRFFVSPLVYLGNGILSDISIPRKSRILGVKPSGYCDVQVHGLCEDMSDVVVAKIYALSEYTASTIGTDFGRHSDLFIDSFYSTSTSPAGTAPTSLFINQAIVSGGTLALPSIPIISGPDSSIKFYVFLRLPKPEHHDVTFESPQNVLF